MLEGLKRWLSGATGADTTGYEGIVAWARDNQATFRGVQDDGLRDALALLAQNILRKSKT